MSQYVETIQIKDGEWVRLAYHTDRMHRTQAALFPDATPADIASQIVIPTNYQSGRVKCRIVYTDRIHRIEMASYTLRPVHTLCLVHDDTIQYHYKSTDRHALQSLYAQRGGADDILIVKNGLITDSYYANIALHRDGQWYTPDHPLLQGTHRAALLDQQVIVPKSIHWTTLHEYDRIRLFNAMLDWGEVETTTQHIKY